MATHPVKKCRRRVCGKEFTPRSTLEKFCSFDCAAAEVPKIVRRGQLKRTAAARKEKREYRARTKTIAKLKAEADKEFGRYIRERDYNLPCVSSGAHGPNYGPLVDRFGGIWDCGHWRTKAAADHLRYDERQCAKQCKTCNGGANSHSGKRATVDAAFKAELIRRHGAEVVEAIENDNRTVKWDRDELVAIRRKYLAAWKARKAQREGTA